MTANFAGYVQALR